MPLHSNRDMNFVVHIESRGMTYGTTNILRSNLVIDLMEAHSCQPRSLRLIWALGCKTCIFDIYRAFKLCPFATRCNTSSAGVVI